MWMPRIAQPPPARAQRSPFDSDSGAAFSENGGSHAPAVPHAAQRGGRGPATQWHEQSLDDARRALAAGQHVRLNISL